MWNEKNLSNSIGLKNIVKFFIFVAIFKKKKSKGISSKKKKKGSRVITQSK